MEFSNDYYSHKIFWQEKGEELIEKYATNESSFIEHLLPEESLNLPTRKVIDILERRLGEEVINTCLDTNKTYKSCKYNNVNSDWLKSVNMVGINVRTIFNFWNVVKYSLTLSEDQDAIHFLPIWEPGVVSSLYGIASWNINPEFFSQELYEYRKELDTTEKQLKVVINILHALGKTVGMDVIPHTDRYSEIVLANPHYFEWLRRDNFKITDHRENLHLDVQNEIIQFLEKEGPAIKETYPKDAKLFFSKAFGENKRNLILFGEKTDKINREKRRELLMDYLFQLGFEPVPATMGPPYRGLLVDPSPEAKTIDSKGRVWRDYTIRQPEQMSRVFGPLTRFKFYGRKNDNSNWEIDFENPRTEVWEYVSQRYFEVQYLYNFDFMRGDMAHVQMRSDGVPNQEVSFYDPLRAICKFIKPHKSYFAYFAETFLAPPGIMAYGDECDHLEMSMVDTTLGDLQSMVPGEKEFLSAFRRYLDIASSRSFKPNFTIITADKDDPRFDKFYLHANESRFLCGLFLNDLPSYMGLGFETRDVHRTPFENEYYTKLFVFKIEEGPKATNGSYRWGKNLSLFRTLNKLKELGEKINKDIKNETTLWLVPPDPQAFIQWIAWTQEKKAQYLFIANFSSSEAIENIKLPINQVPEEIKGLERIFSNNVNNQGDWRHYIDKAAPKFLSLNRLYVNEVQVYRWIY